MIVIDSRECAFFEKVGEKMSILIGLALFLLGGFLGVAVMCIVQVGSLADKEIRYRYSEQEEEGNESSNRENWV